MYVYFIPIYFSKMKNRLTKRFLNVLQCEKKEGEGRKGGFNKENPQKGGWSRRNNSSALDRCNFQRGIFQRLFPPSLPPSLLPPYSPRLLADVWTGRQTFLAKTPRLPRHLGGGGGLAVLANASPVLLSPNSWLKRHRPKWRAKLLARKDARRCSLSLRDNVPMFLVWNFSETSSGGGGEGGGEQNEGTEASKMKLPQEEEEEEEANKTKGERRRKWGRGKKDIKNKRPLLRFYERIVTILLPMEERKSRKNVRKILEHGEIWISSIFHIRANKGNRHHGNLHSVGQCTRLDRAPLRLDNKCTGGGGGGGGLLLPEEIPSTRLDGKESGEGRGWSGTKGWQEWG